MIDLPDLLRPLEREQPDIPSMFKRKDIDGLIRALKDPEPTIQWNAAEALGDLGQEDLSPLLKAIRKKNPDIRLGIIEAFGKVKDPSSVPVLIEVMKSERPEIRWEAALALGEIGEKAATPVLVGALRDPDKYVRYGAAQALQTLQWAPTSEVDEAYYTFAKQEWDRLASIGHSAVDPLCLGLTDHSVTVRGQSAECLGRIGDSTAITPLYETLKDEDEVVRWKAVMAARKCGMPLMRLPRGLSRRVKRRQSPLVAAILNFFLTGIGYLYLGKWWGILLFQVEVYAYTLLTAALALKDNKVLTPDQLLLISAVLLPIYFAFALHAWYMAKQIPEL